MTVPKNYSDKDYKEYRTKILKNILKMAFHGGSSSAHLGGALSMVDIGSVIFKYLLNLSKNNINENDRDYFILSKGHACLAYYSLLSEKGFINESDFKTFEKDGSLLLGHPVQNKKIGIDFSTGSLGIGIGIAVGVALGLRKKKSNNNVYVVLGDGECNEGSVWEALMAASHFKLNNLKIIIDNNNFQQTGKNNDIMNTSSLKKKLEAFNFETFEIDGHNPLLLIEKLSLVSNEKPLAIIAKTIKGKYLSFAENDNKFHHTVLTKNLYDEGVKCIDNL